MCWFSKHQAEPEVRPPSADRVAMVVTNPPSIFANTSSTEDPGGDEVHFACPVTAEPCPNTSMYYEHYCINGICCHHKTLGDEYCACYSQFEGDRCDVRALESMLDAGTDWRLIGGLFAFVIVVVFVVFLVFVFIWRRRRRSNTSNTQHCRNGEKAASSHSVEMGPINDSTNDKLQNDSADGGQQHQLLTNS